MLKIGERNPFLVDNFESTQPTLLGGGLSWVGERLSIQIVFLLYVQIPLVHLMVQLHLLPSTLIPENNMDPNSLQPPFAMMLGMSFVSFLDSEFLLKDALALIGYTNLFSTI